MAVKIAPEARLQYVDDSGDPYSGGLLYTYAAGTTTLTNTYTDSTGDTANANPIVLNASGFTPDGVWLTESTDYKFVLKDSAGATVWSEDNISGVNDTSVDIDEWKSGPTPTYVSATQFTLVGDQTSVFHVGRRLKTTNSGGTIYSRITVSAFTSLTTITVINYSGTLDSGLSAVSYSILSSLNPSIPDMEDDKFLIVDPTDKTKKVRIDAGTVSTATTRAITMPDADVTLVSDPVQKGTTGTITVGYTITVYDNGTKTTGTFTTDVALGMMQKYVNGGAHTLAPPSGSGTILMTITNNASAGAITTSGFGDVFGDAFTTTNAHIFICLIIYDGTNSVLKVKALQ